MTSRSRSFAWLIAALLATSPTRSPGQDAPLYRDPSPTEGARIEGPLLPARPGVVVPPPPSGLGPFQPSNPGPGTPAVPAEAPAMLGEPLLLVPPLPPPLPLMAMPPTPIGDGVEIRRKTTIRAPHGMLGQCHEWFHDTLFGPSKPPSPSTIPKRGLFATIFHPHKPEGEVPTRFFKWPSWPSWPLGYEH